MPARQSSTHAESQQTLGRGPRRTGQRHHLLPPSPGRAPARRCREGTIWSRPRSQTARPPPARPKRKRLTAIPSNLIKRSPISGLRRSAQRLVNAALRLWPVPRASSSRIAEGDAGAAWPGPATAARQCLEGARDVNRQQKVPFLLEYRTTPAGRPASGRPSTTTPQGSRPAPGLSARTVGQMPGWHRAGGSQPGRGIDSRQARFGRELIHYFGSWKNRLSSGWMCGKVVRCSRPSHLFTGSLAICHLTLIYDILF